MRDGQISVRYRRGRPADLLMICHPRPLLSASPTPTPPLPRPIPRCVLCQRPTGLGPLDEGGEAGRMGWMERSGRSEGRMAGGGGVGLGSVNTNAATAPARAPAAAADRKQPPDATCEGKDG